MNMSSECVQYRMKDACVLKPRIRYYYLLKIMTNFRISRDSPSTADVPVRHIRDTHTEQTKKELHSLVNATHWWPSLYGVHAYVCVYVYKARISQLLTFQMTNIHEKLLRGGRCCRHIGKSLYFFLLLFRTYTIGGWQWCRIRIHTCVLVDKVAHSASYILLNINPIILYK